MDRYPRKWPLMWTKHTKAFWLLRPFNIYFSLPFQARRIIGDFGIPISILVSVLVDYSITDTYTQVFLPDSKCNPEKPNPKPYTSLLFRCRNSMCHQASQWLLLIKEDGSSVHLVTSSPSPLGWWEHLLSQRCSFLYSYSWKLRSRRTYIMIIDKILDLV